MQYLHRCPEAAENRADVPCGIPDHGARLSLGGRSTLRETSRSLPDALHSRQYALDVGLVHSPLFRLRGSLRVLGMWQRLLQVLPECRVDPDVGEIQYSLHGACGISNQIAVGERERPFWVQALEILHDDPVGTLPLEGGYLLQRSIATLLISRREQ